MDAITDMFSKTGSDMVHSDLKPMQNIYVDLDYIQDLKFGALLSLVTIPEEMEYVLYSLEKYNKRYTRSIASCFKALKHTDEEIDAALNNQDRIEHIARISPFTSVYYDLNNLVVMLKHHNDMLNNNFRKIKLTINCSCKTYPEIFEKRMAWFLQKQLGVDVSIQHVTSYKLPSEEYLMYDILMLSEYGTFINQHSKAFVADGKFENTRIFAQPYIEEKLMDKIEDPEFALLSTEKNLDVYCDFGFVRPQIVQFAK